VSADDWVKLIGATAGAVALIAGALGAVWVKIANVGRRVDGRMDELLELTAKSSLAEGRLAAPHIHARVDDPGELPPAPQFTP